MTKQVNDCTKMLVPEKTIVLADKQLQLAIIKSNNKENYDENKKNFTALIPGYFDGEYDEFKVERDKILVNEKFDLTLEESMSYISTRLSDGQLKEFVECIRIRNPGLFCYPLKSDENNAQIAIEYVALGGTGKVKNPKISMLTGSVVGPHAFKGPVFAGEAIVSFKRKSTNRPIVGHIYGKTTDGGTVADQFWIPAPPPVKKPEVETFEQPGGPETNYVTLIIPARTFIRKIEIKVTYISNNYRPGDPWASLAVYKDSALIRFPIEEPMKADPNLIEFQDPQPSLLGAGQTMTISAKVANRNLDVLSTKIIATATPASFTRLFQP